MGETVKIMVTLSPVGLAAAPVANQVSFLATFKEKLCRCICATSTNQPFATVTYRNETPVLNGTTVFVPIVATITITTPNAGKVTTGDVTYAANMAYADFYPDPLKDEAACLRYAHKVANDPDGYDGMIFCRWTADAIGKAIKLDWEKFV